MTRCYYRGDWLVWCRCGWWCRWGATERWQCMVTGRGGGTLATRPSLASSTGSSVPSPASHAPSHSHSLTPLSPYNMPPSTHHPAVNISPYISPYISTHHQAVNISPYISPLTSNLTSPRDSTITPL